MKTSSLTRGVFRAFAANQPYIPRDCVRRQLHTKSPARWVRKTLRPQRRTFFAELLGNARPRLLEDAQVSSKNVERAVEKLSDLVRARRLRARAPANDELVDAIKYLCKARIYTSTPLTRTEVYVMMEAYKYLIERGGVTLDQAQHNPESEEYLALTMKALAMPNPKEKFRSDIRELAYILHDYTRSLHIQYEHALILARTGSALDAETLWIGRSPDAEPESGEEADLWVAVLRGFLNEGRLQDFWRVVELLQTDHRYNRGVLSASMQEELVVTLAENDQVWDAERLYNTPVAERASTSRCMRKMLELSLKNGKSVLADSIARQIAARPQEDDTAAALLLWYSVKSHSTEELRDNIHQFMPQLDIDILNSVIAYSLEQNNPILVNSLLRIASNEGLQPNGKTYALRLQYALDHDDMDLAYRMYEATLLQDIPENGSDIPTLNRYAAKLTFQPEPNHSLLMRIVDGLLERGADLDAETLAGLCRSFLRRDELDEVQGILRHRADLLPLTDRAKIAAIFKDFILQQTKDQRAFNVYEVFKYEFPETPLKDRLRIMQHFFDRKRPDFACTVFAHMRQCEPDEPGRPDAAAYSKCFEGIAQCRDVDGLQSVYNMLKLDLQVELTTRIRNGLMLAYISCQMPWTAIIDHFYKIMDSREGPTYSTFEVALRACEIWPPYGSFEARKIIAVMQAWNLEITKDLYDNYIGVMAGQCEFENAVELIEEMENDIGESPDAFTIGTFYNAIPWQFRKDEVEKWAKQAYPELWAELLTYGEDIDEEFEVRYFKLDRSIDIDDEPLFKQGDWKPELARQVQADIEPLPLKV